METTNWRCPTCETVNTGDFCTVCGCQKPAVNMSGGIQQPVNQDANFVQPSFGASNGGQHPGYAPNPGPAPYPGVAPGFEGTPTPAGTPNPVPKTPNPAGMPSTGMSSGKKAWKVISIILLYVISVVLILWVSIMVGTILLAVSVGYNVRVVNGFKNEKARLESERRKMNAMR